MYKSMYEKYDHETLLYILCTFIYQSPKNSVHIHIFMHIKLLQAVPLGWYNILNYRNMNIGIKNTVMHKTDIIQTDRTETCKWKMKSK